MGIRGMYVAMLYHVYLLTESTFQVGLVGAAQGITILLLSPIGGALSDRFDRKRVLQTGQVILVLVSLTLSVVTLADNATALLIILAAIVNAVAMVLERPVRQAILPALVPADQVVRGFAILNSNREVARLVAPAVAGALLAISGPAAVYVFCFCLFLAMIVVLAILHVPPMESTESRASFLDSIVEGFQFVRDRPLMVRLMALDFVAMVFGAYQVVLPELATDILDVGPAGYGLLAAAPPVGALIGAATVYRLTNRSAPAGMMVIGASIGYAMSVILLAQSQVFPLALAAGVLVGLSDAVATTLRHAVVLTEAPDRLRGRVSAVYGMSSQAGPALGDLQVGSLSGLIGVVAALTVGGIVSIFFTTLVAVRSPMLRELRTP
jgi:MFS family permease